MLSSRNINLKFKRIRLRAITLCSVIVIFSSSAQQVSAQQADPAQLQQALARAQGLLRQLAQQKGALEAEKAQMQAKLASVERMHQQQLSKNQSLEADVTTAKLESDRVNNSLGRTQKRLERVEQRLTEVVEKYKALNQDNQKTLQQNAQLEEDLATTNDLLTEARINNEALYQTNKELLAKFVNKGTWDNVLRLEPFTGIKRVEIENIEQEFRFKNEDARLNIENK